MLTNYRGVIFHDTEKYAKLWGKLTCCFKIDIRNLTNFENQVLKSLKNVRLMGSTWAKYILFDLKKYWGVFHDTEEWRKIWKKAELSFGEWQKKFDKFWPEQSKVSTTFTLLCPYWANYIFFELKKYRGIIFHDK